MKRWTVLLFALLLSMPSLHAASPTPKDQAAFDRLKSLAGVWEGDSPHGTTRISYAVVSAGSTVMETIDQPGHAGMMVTMYHLDGDRLMMTHYCSAGNQPRMRLINSTPSSMTFEMFDATNLASDNDAHMRKVVITWADKDHITAAWTMSKDGKDGEPGIFKLTRTS